MRERVVLFGPRHEGLAILTQPEASSQNPSVALLMANVGLTYHVGPFRQFVDLSRKLALAGIASVRFDLSGFGDSEPSERSVTEDFTLVMDRITQLTGINSFLVIGNCLGADHAHLAALSDSRIKGGIFIDGYLKANRNALLRYYCKRLMTRENVEAFFRYRILRQADPRKAATRTESFTVREHWTPERMQDELRQLVKRKFEFLFVYTGHMAKWFNHPKHIHEYFPDVDFKGRMGVKIYPRAGHTFFSLTDRQEFLSDILAWVVSKAPTLDKVP